MKHYIVMINPEFEDAEYIASILSGIVLPKRINRTLVQEVADYLKSQDQPPAAVEERQIIPLDNFIRALNGEETGLSRAGNCYAANIAWAHSAPEGGTGSALEDICHLLKDDEWDLNNVDMKLYDLTVSDTAWLYSRHKAAIVQWQSDKGLTLYDLNFSLEDVFDKSPHILWEVVYRWALQIARQPHHTVT